MIDRLKAIPILFALWLVNTIFRFISVEAAWNLGEFIGSVCYRIMPKRRAIVADNIKIVSKAYPDIQSDEELTRDIFLRSCANLTCSVKTYGMTPVQLAPHLDIQVSKEFTAAIENNSGAILCLAHMGNWEILSKISTLISPSPENFGALYRPLDSKAADNYVAQQRKQYGCQMFPKSTPMGTLSTFIREGGFLGVLADQRSGKSNKNKRLFFGVNSPRSKLPAILHLRTLAPLFSVSVYSEKNAHWIIQILPVSLPEEKLTTDEIVSLITKSYEHNFSSHVLDPFWLHRYWVTNRKQR